MKKWLVGLVCGGMLATAAAGQILAFEFSALAGNEATAASASSDANLAASAISRGAGLTASANGGRFNATGWALTSIANAVSGNNYMEFTITPQSGYQFDVSSIYVQWQRSATGNSVVSLRSSVDGYASDLDSNWTLDDVTTTQNKTWTFTQGNSTAPVTYRLYSYAEAGAGSGGPGDGTGNDIVVNGTVTAAGPLDFSVSLDKSNGFTVEQGASDSITATAANGTEPYGYSWTSTLDESYRTIDNNVLTILATAPTGSYSATVTATDDAAQTASNSVAFSVTAPALKYAIAIVTNAPANGTVTTSPATEAAAGATVTVNATPAGGYVVASIAVVDAALNPVAVTGNTFVMPASAATVTVTFGAAPDFALDFSDLPVLAYADVATTANGVALDIAQCYRDVSAPDYMIRMRWISTNAGYFGNATAFTNGSISKMTFQYKAYGASHTNYQFIVQFKTTGGEWTQVGDTYLASNTDWAMAEVLAVPAGATFFRIQSVAPESGTVIKTGNFDNFGFTFGAATFGVTFDQTSGFAIEEGTSDVITATAANGVAPYSYSWTSSLGESYRTIANDQLTVLATAPVGDYTAQVVATDSDTPAKSVTNSLNFSVTAPVVKYAITITPPANGTVTTTPETEAAAGATVTVNATPAGGYAVESIVVNGGAVTVTGNTFTMPAEPATVTVTFQEASTDGALIISQYYEGASYDKWIEIYNPGAAAVDLAAGGYRLGLWSNAGNREGWKTGVAPNNNAALTGTIPAGGTFLISHTSASNPPYATADLQSGTVGNFSGDDSLVLYTGETYAFSGVVDAFGLTNNTAQDKSFVRKATVTSGVNADFNAADWDQFSNADVIAAAESTNERLGYHSTGAPVFGVALNRANGFTVEQGASDAITATAANGTAPYGYSWTSSLGGAYYTASDNVFTILATAPIGDYFAAVTATDNAAQTASNSVTFSVTAPAPKYAIAIVTNAPANGTVTTTPATEAEAGQTVTVNATPAGGYAVQSIAVVDAAMNPVTVTGNAFTMPAAAVTVTVTFVEASASGELIISQYYEGTSNNKWIEIYNPGSAAIDLAAGAYRLGRWDNANREAWKAGIAPSGSVALSNSIPAGGTYLIGNTSATNPAYAVAGQLSGVLTFTGDDSVVLYKGATYAFANVVDAFGMTATNAMDRSFVRKTSVTAGVNADFNAAEWDEFSLGAVDAAAESTNERLGYHSIGASALGVSLDRTNGFTVAHGTSAAITATATGGTAPYGYSWTSTLGEGYRTAADNVFTILATAPAGDYTATVTATDGAAQTASNTVSFTVLGGGGETWQIGNPDTGGGMFYSTSNQTIMIVLPTNYTLSAVYGTDSSGAGLNNLGQGLGSPLTQGVDYNWNPATRTISVLSGVTNRRVLRIGASSP